MTRFIPLIALCALLPISAVAQDETEERGLGLMERGAQMFMDGIMEEMGPVMEGFEGFTEAMRPALRDFAREMGPKLTELLDEVEDWSAYQAPEMQPNGDIIIRRKPDHPMLPPDTPTEPEPQIDL
ncbi:hypothetical protein HTT03_12035 [Sulfitobacter sp. S0837]|uniref:hypothetical protein n=1 Tax=Sulfitobacter maritimus TaxID=2741719 RepID=UPI0015823047|nr:hypothetical protein [Sulfitobacter maritimus]NUH66014.1 hypothetical protein [Sulfitobacter maritimus]